MYREAAPAIFQMGNFFDELCIIDEEGIVRYYNVCLSDGAAFSVDEVIGKHVTEIFPSLTLETNEVLQALEEQKSICAFHNDCLNYRGERYQGYVSTFPILQRDNFRGIAIALKYLTPDYQDEFIEMQDNSYRRRLYRGGYTIDDIITCDPYMNGLKEKIRKVSRRDSSVLIQGNTGTGKELVAQALHYLSAGSTGPFISQNCSAIPENLLESTLFGTEKGSFTGAVTNQGLFEIADGGTLFLDEINSMSPALQSKILTAVETKTVRRLGGHKDIRINIRIIGAINENPFEAIEGGRLRSDLFYRLNVVNISIPPLRSRKNDIPLLVEKLLEKHNERFGKEVWMVSDKALERLVEYDYPGNVRELENIIMQSVSMADREHVLSEKLLQMPMQIQAIGADAEKWDRKGPLDEYLANLEKEIIREVMITEGGNISRTAEVLHIKRQTLQHKLKKYGMKE